MLLTPSPLVWCSISWIWGSSAIKPWSWKELTAMHLVCVMWCCGVSKLHICHVVSAEASITNSVSAAIDRSVLRPENWDMSKQMLWPNGTPWQRYPVFIPASLCFCFDKRRLTLSTACKNPDVSLLGRKIESFWEQRPCTWSSMFEICIWFRVSARFVQLYIQKHAKAKKRWHPSMYLHQAARTRHPLGIPKTHFK